MKHPEEGRWPKMHHEVATWTWSRPGLVRWYWSQDWLFYLINRVRQRRRFFSEDFDFVFEGYPRSGNTYGVSMLLATQKDRINVISHQHRPFILFKAAELDRPACLCLREATEAVPSWVTMTNFDIQLTLDYYIFFHEVLRPDRSKLLVLPFAVLTKNFKLVLELINMRFGLHLDLDFDLESCNSEAFQRIDTQFSHAGVVQRHSVARPEPSRKGRNDQVRQELLLPRYAASLKRCRELYDLYLREHLQDLDRLASLEARAEPQECRR